MPFSRTALPYPAGDLTPVYSAATVNGLYDGPHKDFVDNANTALTGLQTARDTGNYSNIANLQIDLSKNGSGSVLFNVFWNSMGKDPAPTPPPALAAQIDTDFGTLTKLKAQIEAAGNAVAGDGFLVLVWNGQANQLLVATTPKVAELGQWGGEPIMAIDLYANAWSPNYATRAAYLSAWWQVCDWAKVQTAYLAAKT